VEGTPCLHPNCYWSGQPPTVSPVAILLMLEPSAFIVKRSLGGSYYNFGQADLARKYLKRALELGNRTSARERLDISATYYSVSTRELDKAIDAYQLSENTYPGDRYAPMNLADVYSKVGQYEQCAAANRRGIGIDPAVSAAYQNLSICLLSLDQMEQAKKVVDEALSGKLDGFLIRQPLYSLAFLQSDVPEMQRQLAWTAGRPAVEAATFLGYQADTEAFHGLLRRSQKYSRGALDCELRAGSKEGASSRQAYAALWEAEFGNLVQARRYAASTRSCRSRSKNLNPALQDILPRAATSINQ